MLFWQALYFAIPIFVANMAPVVVSRIPVLGQPIDGGRLWRGKPILGAHKTWRGLLAAGLFGLVAVYVQRFLPVPAQYELVNYDAPDIWQLGLLMGFGAIIGDAIKSFFKRRVGRPSGAPWPPFDQLDFIVGGLLAAALYTPVPVNVVVLLIIVTPFGHILVNRLAFAAGWKSVPY